MKRAAALTAPFLEQARPDDPEPGDRIPSMTARRLSSTALTAARVHRALLAAAPHSGIDPDHEDALADAVARRVVRAYPGVNWTLRYQRDFGLRVIDYAVAHGIRQIVDLGCGFLDRRWVAAYTHHREAQPELRVVLVDHDPIVLRHDQSALPTATTIYGDCTTPDQWVKTASRDLDFEQPILLMLLGVLHHLRSATQSTHVAARCRGLLPPGSLFALTHLTANPYERGPRQAEEIFTEHEIPLRLRSHDWITRSFGDWSSSLIPYARLALADSRIYGRVAHHPRSPGKDHA